MTPKMKSLFVLLLAACAFAANAEKMPYSRYTNIIERQMFGPLPDNFDPTKPPSEVAKSAAARQAEEERAKKEEQLRSNVSFSMINITPDGDVKVGFTDKSKSPPVNYYMGVGEEQKRDAWIVKEVDVDAEEMTIENVKEKIEITLTLGGDSSKDANATKKAGSKAMSAKEKKRADREARKQAEAKYVENLEERNRIMEQENKAMRERQEAAAAKSQENFKDRLDLLKTDAYNTVYRPPEPQPPATPVAQEETKEEPAVTEETQEGENEGGEAHENNDAQ